MNIDSAIDSIVSEMNGNEVTVFTFAQAQQWAEEYGFNRERPVPIIQGLKARGMTMTERQVPRKVAGFSRNDNADRWTVCPSHGGGGGSSIVGIAGYAG